MPLIRRVFYLPEPMDAWLERRAKEEGITSQEMLRWFLHRLREEDERRHPPPRADRPIET